MFWAQKAFFCSNIKSVLQSNTQFQAVKLEMQYIAFYAFLWRLWLGRCIKLKTTPINSEENSDSNNVQIYPNYEG